MEVCVDSLESVIAAYEGEANRIELCSSLNEGGLTPSIGLLKTTKNYLLKNNQRSMKVNCMIRCRVGDFLYNDNEIETMSEDIKKFIEMDVDGLVFGALTPQGLVDESLMKEFLRLIPANSNIKTTFHRAFDVCSDWTECYNQIENLEFDKLLTSGQEKTAFEGRKLIAKLVELGIESSQANKKSIDIIAGAGINDSNLELILNETKCKEFHASCRSSRNSKMIFQNNKIPMGSPLIDEFEIKFTDKKKVKQLVEIYKNFQAKQI